MIYLCDTYVLIDYLKGKSEVLQKLNTDRLQGLGMSAVTYMKLMVGALNKREVGIIKKAFSDFEIIEISEPIFGKSAESHRKIHEKSRTSDSRRAHSCLGFGILATTVYLECERFSL